MKTKYLAATRMISTAMAVSISFTLVPGTASVARANPDESHGSARSEQVLSNIDGLVESVVTYKAPLPRSYGPRPARCDELRFLRYRLSSSSSAPSSVDKIFASMPGSTAGPASQYGAARSTLRQLAAAGKTGQYWVFERRENCVHDTTGIQAANKAKDHSIAVNYYLRGRPVDGKTFAGWQTPMTLVTANMGIAQVVNDMQFTLTHELPNASVRKKKVFVGGHSYGGILAGLYIAWKFPDDPVNGGLVADSIAGAFALDTTVTAEQQTLGEIPEVRSAMSAIHGISHPEMLRMLRRGVLPQTFSPPRIISAPIGQSNFGFPQVAELANIMGMAARYEPDRVTTLDQEVPRSFLSQLTVAGFLSRNYLSAATGQPDPWKIRATPTALLGLVMDDNSSFLHMIQASMGGPYGGAVSEKNFPVPGVLARSPILADVISTAAGTSMKIAMSDPKAVYRWYNFDQTSRSNSRLSDGRPFTSRNDEVTSVKDMARQVSTGMFIDSYENPRTYLDIAYLLAGDRSGQFAGLVNPNWKTQGEVPSVAILGEKSLAVSDGIPIFRDGINNVVAKGYSHLDVCMAAYRQNNGQPEMVGKTLTSLALDPERYRFRRR